MATITPAAVTAVSNGFATNPSYSGTFIPTVWASKLNVKFYASTTFGDVCNTNWEGDIKNLGDKVVINNVPTLAIRDYVIGTNLTYDVPTPSSLELQIDKAKYFGFQVSDVLEYQAKPDLMDTFSTDAGNQLKIAVDQDCWNVLSYAAGGSSPIAAANIGATAGVTSAAYNLGTDAAPVSLTSGNILATITAMASVLDEQNISDGDRWLVITPYERQLLMNSNLAQAQFMGDATSALRNGKIGKIDRFDIYVSNLLPKAAVNKDWLDGADSGKAKRHLMVAGHRSAMTMASQINKVEQVRNPNDFGDYVRALMVYGRKVVANTGLTQCIVAG